jgi:hypothetical protein
MPYAQVRATGIEEEEEEEEEEDLKVRRQNVYNKVGDPSKHKISCITISKSELL